MNQEVFWNLFLDTGAPEAFLLYRGIQRKKGEYYEEKSGCSRNNYFSSIIYFMFPIGSHLFISEEI